MELTLNELLEGNATIIKGKEYLSAKRYIQPFIDKMKPFTEDFKISVKIADQLVVSEKNTIFNRVHVQAILPSNTEYIGHKEVIGFVYGLDVRKPVAKIYKGLIDEDSNNFYVFDSNSIVLQEIVPEEAFAYPIKQLMESTSNTMNVIEQALKTPIKRNEENINSLLGDWIRKCIHFEYCTEFGKIKLSPSMAIEAYQNLFENVGSKFYISKEVESFTTLDAFDAFANIIAIDEKDLMNKFEKTLLIADIFNLRK